MSINANWFENSLLVWCLRDDVACGIDDLRDRLGEITSDALLASVAQARNISVWLPDSGQLRVRDLPALRLGPADAIDLLLSLPPSPADVAGDSIRYWQELAHFVVKSIQKQLFFPSMNQSPEDCQAAWRLTPLPQKDMEHAEQFAAAMPPVCRAIVDGSADAVALVESFMGATTDALIRRAAANDPFFARVHSFNHEDAAAELRWLSALLREDSNIPGDCRELSSQLQQWIAPLEDAGEQSAWTLGFELIEPLEDVESPNPIWRVEFQLHSPDDEAEPIAAAEMWKQPMASGTLRGRKVTERRERFLFELTRASDNFPPLLRVLNEPMPSEVQLSTAEAYEFLRRWAMELKQRDFKIALPAWAEERESQLGLVMNVRPMDDDEAGDAREANRYAARADIAGARMGLDSLLDFNWRVAIGGEELSPRQFEDLVARQSPLVRFGGRWIRVDPDEARAAAEVLNREAERLTLGQAIRAAYGITRGDAGVRFLGMRGSAWIKDLIEQTPSQKLTAFEQPPDFAGTLRPYQLRGLQWLAFLNSIGIGGCLADDMGLGKTIQFIALLLHERGAGRGAEQALNPTLLFAPTSVVGNWVKELERFAPELRVLLHHGPQRKSSDEFVAAAKEHDLIVTTYALAHRDVAELQRVPWHRIALDEAQKIKNPSAASSVAIRSLSAPHRVALTGTPIENHLSELWSIMDMLNPGLLGTAREFRERFAVPVERLADQERAVQLRQMIRPFVLRRTKADPEIAGDLPDKMEMKVFCTLTAEQAAMYQRMTAQMLGEIDQASGIRRRGLILAVLTRLKQICDHPALLTKDPEKLEGRSGKCERLVDMLEEVIEEGEAALVFTQYREMGDLLEKMLVERLHTPVLFLHGGTPQKQRDEMVVQFQAESGGPRIFLLSLRAGGLGLNLTAASHVFHFDRWWNPAVEAQATDRAHRIGQNKRVQVHKFVCMGTVEERIDKLLSEKTQLAENIVGSGDEWLTNLSTTELAEYLKLSEAAIGEF